MSKDTNTEQFKLNEQEKRRIFYGVNGLGSNMVEAENAIDKIETAILSKVQPELEAMKKQLEEKDREIQRMKTIIKDFTESNGKLICNTCWHPSSRLTNGECPKCFSEGEKDNG